LRDTVLARRYAKALFDLALEKQVLDDIHKEVVTFSELLKNNQDLRLFFFAQDISHKQKANILARLLDHKVSKIFQNFMLILVRKGRASVFPTVVEELARLVDKYYKRIHAMTTTAVAIEDGLRERLKTTLDGIYGADVSISNKVDPAILGGIIVRIEGQVLDGSLYHQLQRLKKAMLEKKFESV